MTVKGEKHSGRKEEGEGYFFSEREYGRFQRIFRLRGDVTDGWPAGDHADRRGDHEGTGQRLRGFKLAAEWMMESFDRPHGLRLVRLRYFNACRADPEGGLWIEGPY